mgnify:CR=1 FL=1
MSKLYYWALPVLFSFLVGVDTPNNNKPNAQSTDVVLDIETAQVTPQDLTLSGNSQTKPLSTQTKIDKSNLYNPFNKSKAVNKEQRLKNLSSKRQKLGMNQSRRDSRVEDYTQKFEQLEKNYHLKKSRKDAAQRAQEYIQSYPKKVWENQTTPQYIPSGERMVQNPDYHWDVVQNNRSRESVTFTKEPYADVNDPANWDHITESVAIMRAEYEGLYNPYVETGFIWEVAGPSGTQWALGSTDEALEMGYEYTSWADAINWCPPCHAGNGDILSLYIIDENEYWDVEVHWWTSGEDMLTPVDHGGGFSYTRTLVNNEQPEMVTISGRVRDFDGNPLDSVFVGAYQESEDYYYGDVANVGMGFTDANGDYTFQVPVIDDYTVVYVTDENYYTDEQGVFPDKNALMLDGDTEYDVFLGRRESSALVTVNALDDYYSLSPIRFVNVVSEQSPGGEKKGDWYGNAFITVVAPLDFFELEVWEDDNADFLVYNSQQDHESIEPNNMYPVQMIFDGGEPDLQLGGTVWEVIPGAGAIGVGPEPYNMDWWANSDEDVETRWCFFDDQYAFDYSHNDGAEFHNDHFDETWVETWQAGYEGCGTPVYPHDGSNNPGQWSYDPAAGGINIMGYGAYIGLPRAVNGTELASPLDAPDYIWYELDYDPEWQIMTLFINVGADEDVYWTYHLRQAETEEEGSLAGAWKIVNEPGAIGVGPEPHNMDWWSNSEEDLEYRWCYFDDLFIFGEDGSFHNELQAETWLEYWQIDYENCGEPVYPHDGSEYSYYEINDETGEITIHGYGAYIGIPKVVNGYELSDPDVEVPYSRTYQFYSDNNNPDRLSLVIETHPGTYWTFWMEFDHDDDGGEDFIYLGWTESNGERHDYYASPPEFQLDWEMANGILSEEEGIDLVTITSEEENQFLTHVLDEMGIDDPFYTGGYYNADDYNWHWATGESWDYENWADGQPDGVGEGRVLVFNDNGFGPGEWDDWYGGEQLRIIIELSNDTQDDFEYLGEFNGSEYYLSDSAMDWYSAQNFVEQHDDADLVAINSEEENNFLMESVPGEPAWIGLHAPDSDWSMVDSWTNGEPITYTNWAPNEPNNSGDCAIFNYGPGQWDDQPGAPDNFRFIVEVRDGQESSEPPHLHIAHDVPNDQGRQMRIVWNPGDPGEWGHYVQFSMWRHLDGTEWDWDFIGMVPWHGMHDYSAVVPTLGDSTHNGIHWSTFMVKAHTEDPNVFFDSEPITGYSVDNLHPQTPGGVQADIGNDGIVLSWHGPVDADFDHHKVYRFNLNAQDPAEEYSTVDTFFVDEVVDGNYEYWVSAVDYNGNESDPSEVVSVLLDVDVAIALPTEFALQQNYPNPFNPSTQIQYAVPTDANVTIAIYDLMGRKVRTLVNGNVTAGYHTTMWNATNDLGQPVAAGMYIYTISSHDYLAKKKMVLLK